MNELKSLRKKDPLIFFLILIICVLAACFIIIGFTDTGGIFAQFLGTADTSSTAKKATIEFITFIMGGVVATIVAIAIYRRAEAQTKTAEAQAKTAEAQMETVAAQVENNKLIEKGHIDERFKSATEHLGNENKMVRISAFYQFYYLAKNHPDNEFRKSIFEILCSYLRAMPHDKSHLTDENGDKYITEECQTLLNVLFKPKEKTAFSGFHANLQGACLVRADLDFANLSSANLAHANLSEATMHFADISSAYLFGANFEKADLFSANLKNIESMKSLIPKQSYSVNFKNAHIHGADLSGANLRHANLEQTNLSNAILKDAFMFYADLSFAYLYGADIENTHIQDVLSIKEANFCGAKMGNTPVLRKHLPYGKGEPMAYKTNEEFREHNL